MNWEERVPTLEPHNIFTIKAKFEMLEGKPRVVAELEWGDLYKLPEGGATCDGALAQAALDVIQSALTRLARGAMTDTVKETWK